MPTSDSVTCRVWQPGECEGTSTCPPRCPRFVTTDGTPILVEPEYPSAPDAGTLSPPPERTLGPDDLFLSARVDGRLVGYVLLQPVTAGDRRAELRVARDGETPVPDGTRDELAAELARQAVAYAISDGAGRLFVEDDTPFERAGFDLSPDDTDEATGDRTDRWQGYVPLTDPTVAQVTTPPARDEGRVQFEDDNRVQSGGDASRVQSDDDFDAADDRPPAVPDRTTNHTLPTGLDGRDLSGLFAPERIAVVGATDREGSIGRLLLENLADYAGDVVPVTPRADTVFGRDAPDSLGATEHVDLAVVAVPPEAALDALETAGEQGIEHAVVVSAGFEEAGPAGQRHSEDLREVVDRHDLTVVGPNSMGVMSTASGLNASFSPRHPARGSVSLLSQSGAFITASLADAADRGLGFRHVVSVGNKTAVGAADFLRYLDADPETTVVAAYLEDIDEAFVETAREVSPSTPIVVLKPGRTEAGASAAASHTGSLASDDTAVDAALEQAGVLRADSAEELFDYAAALRGTIPDGDAVGVVTNAGGPGVLATDAVAASGRELAALDPDTRERLAGLLPPPATVGNPTDVLGDADSDRFATAIDAVLGDPNVDVGLVVTTPHPLIDYAALTAAVGRRSQARGTPVVTAFMDGDLDADTKRALRRYGVANYDTPARAARALDGVRRYAALQRRLAATTPTPGEAVDIDEAAVRAIIEDALAAGRDSLGVASLDLLEACAIPVPAWGLAETPGEAAAIAADIGDSVVLKVASPEIVHKVDVGGVRVGVSPGDVEAAATELLDAVREARPDAEIDGILVQELVGTDDAVETVVGATDSQFGPLVTFGLGGVLVEHVEDVAFALAPLDHERARELLEEIEAASVLEGARGREPVDTEALADVLVRLSALLATAPEIVEIDLNPVLADSDGVTAVDLHVELG